ncbi:transcription factor BHLH42 [Benincasa hispida]|uniref:transcription factor BHLH42 n=1 Tax=Benincasa hispida TaxID=102211 RepID=UPI001901E086|nr:transcription factor BHLH42 [Benincasa hispida]
MEGMLQFAVQSVEWTYSLFWRFSTQQRMLIWGNGFYNGPIKTTKTVHPAAGATTTTQHHQHSASLSLHRTHQLTDLYNSLSAADTCRPTSAALSPEDLTESEWFYLLCLSFSFPPGLGLPGKAYSKNKHVWVTGANEIDSKIFSRAILAKSAGIKTVVCIPVMDGVVELGTTDKVKEDMGFIQHIKSIFVETEKQWEAQKPAVSELSTSNSATSLEHYYYKHLFCSTNSGNRKELELEDEMDSDSSTSNSSNSNAAGGGGGCPCWPSTVAAAVTAGEPSELIMQLEPSEDIRLGSPDDASNNFLPNLSHSPPPDLHTNFDYHPNPHPPSNTNATTQLQLPTLEYSSAAVALITENQDIHYSNMLSAILDLNQNHQSSQWLDSSAGSNITFSTQSAFSKWTCNSDYLYRVPTGTASTSQCLLKSILHTIPFLHKHHRDHNQPRSCDGQWRNGMPQDFLTHSELLNDKFIILRSVVPFATKMDNASVLGDTVKYLEQLRQKIQDLEAQNREFHSRTSFQELQRNAAVPRTCFDKRKLRILEGIGDGCTRPKVLKSPSPITSLDTNLQVSIIGSDGLLELQCPYKEGLLLDILLILQGLRIETTSVSSSVSNGVFTAELRAKVKENTDGKKASILEVKSAIQQIIPCVDT